MRTLQDNSISRRLTWMNLLVSGAALLLACAAFIAYDMLTFRATMVRNLSTEAQIIGSNSVSALLFNDAQSAENTLSALKAAHNILSAGIYSTDGRLFASYSRDPGARVPAIPALSSGQIEIHWFKNKEVVLVRSIVFEGKPTGTVYIRSDVKELDSRLQRYVGIASIVLFVCLVAALLVSSIFRKAIAQPIVHLAEIARIVSRDKNYTVRARPTGKRDEPDILIGAFNEMLGQIQEREAALQQAHDELEQRVVERTAQLETAKKEVEEFSRSVVLAEEETRRQKELLELILGSIADGVVVADSNGKFLLFNAAAEQVLGMGATDSTPGQWSDRYGAYLPDTVTQYPPDQLPLVRAMRGESVDEVELFIRNAQVREGRFLSIAGRPLKGADGALKGGVVVFHDMTERKRAQEALQQSEKRTRLVIETAYDPFIGMDAEGLIGEWNHQAEVTFGWSREEAIGKVLAELIVPAKYREAHKQGLKHFLATGEGPVLNKRIEITALHRDGHEFPVELTISPIRMGQTSIFNAFVQDITERKRAEEALRQSEQRYHLLFDSNPHPVWVCDWKTFAFLDVNDSAVRNYGYSRDEFLSLTIKDIRPPEEVPALLESFAKAPPNTEIAGIRKHRKKNGTLIDVEISSHPLVYAGRDARLVVATDITTRKKAEAALRQSEERFRSLVEGVQDYAIFMLDSKGFVASWNSGAEHIKGYKAAEIIGKHFSCFHSSEDLQTGKPQNELEAATREGRIVDEGWRVRKDGSRFWANVVITAVRDTQGHLVGFSKITRDLTAHKQAEELIMHAKEEAERASKFKDQFLSTMSHELRTPLNAVLGFSDLLADERYGPLNDRQQRYVSHIHSGGKHLLKLISDILDLSKIEAGRMELTREDVTVASAFVEVISALYPLAEKKSQALLQQVDPNLRVHADAMRFKQVLMNLVGNAIKFTPEGGRIDLAACKVDDQVKIEVRDNGPGIPPEQQQRIFEAFFRLTETGSATEGTGLGLAITARLVELHGSKLGIESQPGEGTCFYFSLPLIAITPDQPTQASIPIPRARKAPRILVIEDNAVTGHLIQSQLTSSGYETLRCDKPERARDMAAEHQPDAITLDLLMEPVHGLEVLLQLKNDPRTSKIPVIVVTIVDQPGLGTALGADEYLIKPVDKATLLAAVERCLRSRGGAAPTRTILVVEDDVSTLEVIVELLKAYGYAVSTAADGEQARVSVAQSLPELVILDLVLPKMSGFELLAEWRSNPRTADLSVFVLTSKDLTKEEEKYLHAHAESLFRKQNSWREPLIKQLERVVTSPSLENA